MQWLIYSEQDDNDLTYFINYNINRLEAARKDFQIYITKKLNENRSTVFIAQKQLNLNERQIKLLRYLHQDAEFYTNIVAYQKIYSVKKTQLLMI